MKTFELGGEINTKQIADTISVDKQISGCISNLVGLAHLAFASHRHMRLNIGIMLQKISNCMRFKSNGMVS